MILALASSPSDTIERMAGSGSKITPDPDAEFPIFFTYFFFFCIFIIIFFLFSFSTLPSLSPRPPPPDQRFTTLFQPPHLPLLLFSLSFLFYFFLNGFTFFSLKNPSFPLFLISITRWYFTLAAFSFSLPYFRFILCHDALLESWSLAGESPLSFSSSSSYFFLFFFFLFSLFFFLILFILLSTTLKKSILWLTHPHHLIVSLLTFSSSSLDTNILGHQRLELSPLGYSSLLVHSYPRNHLWHLPRQSILTTRVSLAPFHTRFSFLTSFSLCISFSSSLFSAGLGRVTGTLTLSLTVVQTPMDGYMPLLSSAFTSKSRPGRPLEHPPKPL